MRAQTSPLPMVSAANSSGVRSPSELWGRTEYDLSSGMDWLVFDRDGALLGSVHTPPEFRLQAIRAEYVVGLVLDEFDVPFVRRYPLLVENADPD
jgi:hypothetical protein